MTEQRIAENLPDWIKDHLERYINSNGADGHLWDASAAGGEGMLHTLLLTTTGRKSGLALTLPLIYGKTETGYCVIASKGGAPAHPLWYENLVASPQVHIQVGRDEMDAVARTAVGEERAQLWSELAELYAPYEDYQRYAGDREIPVVVLDPT